MTKSTLLRLKKCLAELTRLGKPDWDEYGSRPSPDWETEMHRDRPLESYRWQTAFLD
jgi:hypothetical protein